MISKTGLGPAFVELSVYWERQIPINKHKDKWILTSGGKGEEKWGEFVRGALAGLGDGDGLGKAECHFELRFEE